jgi:hypothetical protein
MTMERRAETRQTQNGVAGRRSPAEVYDRGVYPFIAVFISALITRRQFSVTHSLPIVLPAERYHS